MIIIFLFKKFTPSGYQQKDVNNHVENDVDKVYVIHTTSQPPFTQVDIHTLINKLFKTFPPFFINKRYKLIIFAPIVNNVDKLCFVLKHNIKQKE